MKTKLGREIIVRLGACIGVGERRKGKNPFRRELKDFRLVSVVALHW
jgi:hypothetical protein